MAWYRHACLWLIIGLAAGSSFAAIVSCLLYSEAGVYGSLSRLIVGKRNGAHRQHRFFSYDGNQSSTAQPVLDPVQTAAADALWAPLEPEARSRLQAERDKRLAKLRRWEESYVTRKIARDLNKNGWSWDKPTGSCDCSAQEAIDLWYQKNRQEGRDFSSFFAPETAHWDPTNQRCDCHQPVQEGSPGGCSVAGAEQHPEFVLVTGLVDIGRKGRGCCAYASMVVPHLHRECDLIFYGEEWAIRFAREVRRQAGLENRTEFRLIESDLGKAQPWLGYNSLLPKAALAAKMNYRKFVKQGQNLGYPDHVAPLYPWLMWEKTWWLKSEADLQAKKGKAKGGRYIVWVDAGAGHGTIQVPRHFCACNLAVPGTATFFVQCEPNEAREQGCGWPPLKDLNISSYLQDSVWHYNWALVMGTFFGGDAEGLQWLYKTYRQFVETSVEAGIIDDDQAYLALVAATNEKPVRLIRSGFYGIPDIC